MKRIIGANIARLRKERKMTQEQLADILNISFQAISKWETGQALPDIISLNAISEIMKVNIEEIIGYKGQANELLPYSEWYKSDDYYWGTAPSELCINILKIMPPTKPLRVLDVGCGEGRNSVFFARCGYIVSAFDIAEAGVEKTKRLAEKTGVFVDAFRANIETYRLDKFYDIIFSSGALHYIKPELRDEIVSDYKLHTVADGINVMNVFVEKPYILPAPEKEKSYLWKSGELLEKYHDWQIVDFSEKEFDCNSSGVPHKHAMNIMISKNVRY